MPKWSSFAAIFFFHIVSLEERLSQKDQQNLEKVMKDLNYKVTLAKLFSKNKFSSQSPSGLSTDKGLSEDEVDGQEAPREQTKPEKSSDPKAGKREKKRGNDLKSKAEATSTASETPNSPGKHFARSKSKLTALKDAAEPESTVAPEVSKEEASLEPISQGETPSNSVPKGNERSTYSKYLQKEKEAQQSEDSENQSPFGLGAKPPLEKLGEGEQTVETNDCGDSVDKELCVQNKFNFKIAEVVSSIENLGSFLRVICANSKAVCADLFKSLQKLDKYKPETESPLTKKAKAVAAKSAKKIVEIAVEQLEISDEKDKKALTDLTSAAANDVALKIVEEAPASVDESELEKVLQRAAEEESKKAVEDYWTRVVEERDTQLAKLSPTSLVKGLTS